MSNVYAFWKDIAEIDACVGVQHEYKVRVRPESDSWKNSDREFVIWDKGTFYGLP